MIAYEDDICTVIVGEAVTNDSHAKIIPKQTVESFEELDSNAVSHMFTIASKVGTLLFEGLQAKGTNIIIKNGEEVAIHVIARFENDGLDFTWQPKQGDMNQIQSLGQQIKGAMPLPGQSKQKKEQSVVVKEQKETKPQQETKEDSLHITDKTNRLA